MKLMDFLDDGRIKCLKMHGFKVQGYMLETEARLTATDYMKPFKPWEFEERLERRRRRLERANGEVKEFYISATSKAIVISVELPPAEKIKASHAKKTDADREREAKIIEDGKKLVADLEEKAQERLENFEFPQLTGTEKQISWADSIRTKFFVWCEKRGVHPDIIVKKETSAKFWIEGRNVISPANVKDYEDFQKYKEMVFLVSEKPEEIKHDGVVEVVGIDGRIFLFYKKEDDFRKIAKSNGFSWENAWSKKTENAKKDISEIENELLNNGYCVCTH